MDNGWTIGRGGHYGINSLLDALSNSNEHCTVLYLCIYGNYFGRDGRAGSNAVRPIVLLLPAWM